MLKFADCNDANNIKAFLGNGIIPLRICSYMTAYGFDKDFVKFWISRCDDNNEINGVIALFENSLLLHINNQIEASEIVSFISMLQFGTLSCEKETALICGFSVYEEKQGFIFEDDTDECSADDIDEDIIKNAYQLICESIPGSFTNSKNAYLSFLSDYTYRKRRNLARGKCIKENNSLVSCAFTSAETNNEALLSGVATDKNLRKGGYGKRTVLSLVHELLSENKTAYVIALNDSAINFYEHIGFKKDKIIAYINRKDI